jgi:hypothetical protein
VYVSVTRTRGTPDQPLETATIAGEEMLPWLREIDGFDGLLMLTNEAAATTLAITFWRDRDVAERHRAARMAFRDRVTAAVNVNVEETADFDVSFVHLGPRLAELQR